MKKIWNSFALCFSMYSILPAGKVQWENGSKEYVYCFFPLIGILIGGLEYAWLCLAQAYDVHVLLYGAVATLLPTLLSGGIHIDGLIDSCDAMGSYGNTEKKLQILKDPHVGAFGVIFCVLYFLLTLGLFAQLFVGAPNPLLWVIFALSRTVSGWSTVRWKSAKSSGLQYLFAQGSNRKLAALSLLLWGVGLFGFMLHRDFPLALVSGGILLLFFMGFYGYIRRQFGGMTGDLAGFSMCMAELILLGVCAFGSVVGRI